MLQHWRLIALVAALVAAPMAIATAQETEADDETATEADETTEGDETTAEPADEPESADEGEELELDCDGKDLAEFTAHLNEAAANHGVDPPSEEQIQEIFNRADQNGDGEIGRREAHRLAEHGPRPGRHHARVWRHRIRCRQAAE